MATHLECTPPLMTRPAALSIVTVGAVLLNGVLTVGQTPPVATFKSSVDLVRVTAVVRDHKGRFVQDLSMRDFEILEGTRPQRIVDFRRDSVDVSVALLFDVSGSMEGRLPDAREAANHILSWLDAQRDEAAVFM